MPQFPYKSFCWSLGTTSFRTKSFNKTIEEQLKLLRQFWSLSENKNEVWNANDKLQTRYYEFMKLNNFVVGEANNKPKDAREKTSGLVDLGIIYDNRRITPAGEALLAICDSNDFVDNNLFQIDKDSFIYLKQLLKVSNDINSETVRPFIILIYVLFKLETLTLDEFTYLLPLCVDKESTDRIIDEVSKLRTDASNLDEIIINQLLSMSNYKNALDYFINNPVSEETIMDIGMNRKSRSYDKPYYSLYKELESIYLYHHIDREYDLYEATKRVNIGGWWRSYLFDTSSSSKIRNDLISHLNSTRFDSVVSEEEFKRTFFELMHLFKAKATLSDYKDLNRRYFKTSDVVLFIDDEVKLDTLPKSILDSVALSLYGKAFVKSDDLFNDVSLAQIDKSLDIEESNLLKLVSKSLGTEVSSLEEAQAKIQDERYSRFHHLLDSKFTNDKLLTLLNHFENRDDDEIQRMVTDNADIPTIFEYILGIIWYKVSEMKGKILDYLKLSLDADLLPKTHAGGGEADIVYEYPACEYYPKHSVLLEATLADNTNQRRMEMEPVSRHLGQHLLRTGDLKSYCVFLTTFLHINVVSDFRSRKTTPYYDSQDYSRHVDGMKIIPVQTSELRKILNQNTTYKELYPLFEAAYISNEPPHLWYEKTIVNKLGD